MSHILVKYHDNWADEMNLTGFAVMTVKDWKAIQEEVKTFFQKKKCGWTFGVGTNEDIEYENYADWRQTFTQAELHFHESTLFISCCKAVDMKASYDDPRLLIEEGLFPLPQKYEIEELEDED
jgi:hypothetical protein